MADNLDEKAKMLITTAAMLWKPITLGELDQILTHAQENLYRLADTKPAHLIMTKE